jgi:hypothetical protein
MTFYVKKTFVDPEPGIEMVNIHYTWTPLGEMPNWQAHHEVRMMPRGGVLMRGLGGTTLDESGQYVQSAVQTIALPDDGRRRKVLRLPKAIPDRLTGGYTEHYAFHYYFELFQYGRRQQSPLYTEEIVSREVEYSDFRGDLSATCLYWSISDGDAPQYTPTEEANFIAAYGQDNPYRSHKLYGAPDKDAFLRARSELIRRLPLPRRFIGKLHGPKGTQVHQNWHVVNLWQPNPSERWEAYWGYLIHTL